jgi:hypothetical protein
LFGLLCTPKTTAINFSKKRSAKAMERQRKKRRRDLGLSGRNLDLFLSLGN